MIFVKFHKKAVTGRVLRADEIVVGTGDSVDGCDSKMTHESMAFLSLVAWGCDKLAVVEVAAGWKRTSLEVGRLVWTLDTSSVCSTTLGARVRKVVLVELGGISTFSTFGVKSTFNWCVSRAAVTYDGVSRSDTIEDSLVEEKTVKFRGFLL